jgi:hypothetical protein
MEALLSTVQMPSGIPVATVAIDGGVNAALLALEILAVADDDLAEKLIELFGKRFCRDAVVENITGGGEYAYRGCNIRILETCVFMLNCKDFSVLRGN